MIQTYAYGFPRLGKNREYKKDIEAYWNKKISEAQLLKNIHKLENEILTTYERYVDKFPVGEMTLYDNLFDTALILGLYSYGNLDEYYQLCRGKNALELTKWFNTNYHYLVPELNTPSFNIVWNKPKEALYRYNKGIPYLIGPFTFLKLSKGVAADKFREYLLSLANTYRELIKDFNEVHIDEPAFVMELTRDEVESIKEAYKIAGAGYTNINLFTYYGSLDFLKDLYELPVKALGLDFINGKDNLRNIKREGFPENKTLIAGIVNGRNVWKTNIEEAIQTLKELSKYTKNLIISNASPLYHLPITLSNEGIEQRLFKKLSFAEERLYELRLIARAYEGESEGIRDWNKEDSNFGLNQQVKERVAGLSEQDFLRDSPYAERSKKQREVLNLPLFPTTTIGSFPQTQEIRAKRAEFRSGKISQQEYKTFVKQKITELVKFQEDIGLDVLVHGEFERSDMVEFFAEKLEGIATTKKGWVLSYGTRTYRPPIIYGDISRPRPLTIEEISFAQSLTQKPVKGMLTGPVTIIAWSFLRDDIPVSRVAYQISLCLQDEIKDYEQNNIKIIQIDEPAFRESVPIKKREWDRYFDWAIKSFRLLSRSRPETQIHTHMCYSEFGEILKYIYQMDFDVISIEASRSRGDIIRYFENISFDRQIGLGVWDIHSSVIPDIEDMQKIIRQALKAFPPKNFWINPDCGLKTRGWKETTAGLKNLVSLAKILRKEIGDASG
jgi:5-methyltetrahydropteroyltriglutamate--homocysteine methyltransferase